MTVVNMKKRLLTVADSLDNISVLCDVGCDHGYLPIYLLKKGKINNAVCCDINLEPLMRAKSNACKYNVSDKMEFLISDGLKNVGQRKFDAISICGMGGINIANIIHNDLSCAKKADILVLQPMSEICFLRKFLCENEFIITAEFIAKEKTKFYNIICAKKGAEIHRESFDFTFGRLLFSNNVKYLDEYIDKNIKIYSHILNARKGREDTKELEMFILELNSYKKLINLTK